MGEVQRTFIIYESAPSCVFILKRFVYDNLEIAA